MELMWLFALWRATWRVPIAEGMEKRKENIGSKTEREE